MPFHRPTVLTTELSEGSGGGKRLLKQMQTTPFVTLPATPPASNDRVLEFACGTARDTGGSSSSRAGRMAQARARRWGRSPRLTPAASGRRIVRSAGGPATASPG